VDDAGGKDHQGCGMGPVRQAAQCSKTTARMDPVPGEQGAGINEISIDIPASNRLRGR
jgi:hypothetical protein